MINNLRDYNLVKMREGNPSMTLEEIGRKFGLTRERTRQILSKYGTPTRHKEPFLCHHCGKDLSIMIVEPVDKERDELRRLLLESGFDPKGE